MARFVATDLDFRNVSRITNLPQPTASQDAATKSYVDSAVEGLAWKDSARVATQGNINLASPGATIDGITMALNDRVLVRAQTSAAENGIYIWNGASSAMTRALDANTAAELEQAIVTVEEGTSAGVSFRQTSVNFTLGTDSVSWTQFGTAAPVASESTAGIARIATQAEADAGTADNLIITPLKLANWAGRIRKYAVSIGDGSATQFIISHNLNTRDVHVAVFRNSMPYDEVLVDVEHAAVNAVVVRFSTAPATNAMRVVVVG